MDKIRSMLNTTMAASLLAAGIVFSSSATAGTIILEGSDAIGLHSGGPSFASTYRDQVWKAIGSTDPRPIAAIGPRSPSLISTTHPVVSFATVAAAGPLSSYVALYFIATGGCCSENDSLVLAPGAAAAVGTYLGAGGTVMIQNYIGGTAWDFAVGSGGAANKHVSGVDGGIPGGSTCSDGEKVTAEGIANGFTQPGSIGCWTHQAYDQKGFFAGLGFIHSFFDGGSGYPAGFSSLLSSGLTVTGAAAPEPGTLAVLALGLLGLGWSRRKAA